MEEMKTKRERFLDAIYLALAAAFVLFQLYTALFGVLPGMEQRGVHLIFILVLLYFGNAIQKGQTVVSRTISIILLLMSIVSVMYVILIYNSYQMRSGITIASDIVFGIMLILVLLDATRRTMGWSLAIVVCVFIAYAFLGNYMPSLLKFSGYKLGRFIHITVFTSDGVMGSVLSMCATYIVLFIILGVLFQETGVGNYFTDLAASMFGRMRGGPAKVAVIASALFGSISGSAVANVVGTGTFTIPMMKKIGFDKDYAGAVEAAASTGGQIMPPVMGAAAFVMAEIIDTAYSDVVRAAWIPALLYFAAILMMIDLNARKNKIMGANAGDLPVPKEMFKDAFLILPLVFLIILMTAFDLSVTRAGIFTVIFTIIVTAIKKSSRLNLEKLKRIALSSAKNTISVAVACAVIGVISAIVLGSGLSFRLSNVLVKIAGGNLFLLLLLTMVTSIILGMGGMGSAVAEALSQEYPVPLEMVGIHDRFGESGAPEVLMEAFGLTGKNVAAAARRVIARKIEDRVLI